MGGKQFSTLYEPAKVDGKTYPSFYQPYGGYGAPADLLQEYNCLHFTFPIILGVSEPNWDSGTLEAYKRRDNRTFEYEGKKYTGYQATQMQRKLETAIRRQKDLANAAKAAGDDILRRQAQSRINTLETKYADFSWVANLSVKENRKSVAGFRPVSVANPQNSGIIKPQGVKVLDTAKKLDKHEVDDCFNTTNPLYPTGRQYKENCQRCVSAYEARRRGFDVIASERIYDGTDTLPYMMNPKGWPAVYENGVKNLKKPDGNRSATIKRSIENMMLSYGDGSRAIIRVQWKSGGGHVFIAEQVDGVTQFIDPQSSTRDCSWYFNAGMIKPESTRLLRIDDKAFTGLIEKCIKIN